MARGVLGGAARAAAGALKNKTGKKSRTGGIPDARKQARHVSVKKSKAAYDKANAQYQAETRRREAEKKRREAEKKYAEAQKKKKAATRKKGATAAAGKKRRPNSRGMYDATRR